MDEVLEAVELLADSGFEGVIVWILRIIGILAVLTGLGLWLLTEMGLLVIPAVMIVVGIALVVLPGLLLEIAELFV